MRATLRDLRSIFERLVISLFYGGFFACIALLMTGPFVAQLSVTGARGVLVVSVLGFIIWRFAGGRILGRVFTQRRIAALHTKAQDLAAAVDSRPLFRVPSTLVVKSGRDEAKIWLTLVDRLASLLSGEILLRATSRLLLVGAQAVDWLQRHRRTVLVPAAIALGILLNLLGSTRWKGIQLKGLVLMPAVLLMLVSVMHSLLFVAIAFVVRGSTLAFGQSLFLSVVAMIRASDHLTDGATPGLDVATVALPATAFHHVSFYVDPAAIGSIGEWIADTLSKAPARTEG